MINTLPSVIRCKTAVKSSLNCNFKLASKLRNRTTKKSERAFIIVFGSGPAENKALTFSSACYSLDAFQGFFFSAVWRPWPRLILWDEPQIHSLIHLFWERKGNEKGPLQSFVWDYKLDHCLSEVTKKKHQPLPPFYTLEISISINIQRIFRVRHGRQAMQFMVANLSWSFLVTVKVWNLESGSSYNLLNSFSGLFTLRYLITKIAAYKKKYSRSRLLGHLKDCNAFMLWLRRG